MALQYIGQATGVNSATLPAHQAGDIILAFAFRNDTATAPSQPAAYSNIASGGNNGCGRRLSYFISDGSTTTGTFANATALVCQIYRALPGETISIGDKAQANANSSVVSYAALTLTDADGSSWVAGFAGHRSIDTSLETPPTGMTNRTDVVHAADEAAGHDTNGGVTAWSLQTVSVGGTALGWGAVAVEIVVTAIVKTLIGLGAACSQAATSAAGAVTQGQVMVGQACGQAASAASGAVTQIQQLAGQACAQSADSAAGAITQVQVLAGVGAAQAGTSAAGAVTQDQVIAGQACGQAAGATTGSITQVQQLAGQACGQSASGASGAVTQVHQLGGVGAAQAATSAAGAIVQSQQLAGAAAVQAAVSPAGAITLSLQMVGADCVQANASGAGAIFIAYKDLPATQRWAAAARSRAWVAPGLGGRAFAAKARGRAWTVEAP